MHLSCHGQVCPKSNDPCISRKIWQCFKEHFVRFKRNKEIWPFFKMSKHGRCCKCAYLKSPGNNAIKNETFALYFYYESLKVHVDIHIIIVIIGFWFNWFQMRLANITITEGFVCSHNPHERYRAPTYRIWELLAAVCFCFLLLNPFSLKPNFWEACLEKQEDMFLSFSFLNSLGIFTYSDIPHCDTVIFPALQLEYTTWKQM